MELGAKQDRSTFPGAGRPSQGRCEFSRVQWGNASVAFGGGQEYRGIGRALADPMIRRVRMQEPELLGIAGRAVLWDPQLGDQEALIAEHVRERYAGDGGSKQLRVLGHSGGDQ